MQDSLRDRYDLANRRRHGDIQEYPYVINLFPSLYLDYDHKLAEGPFSVDIDPGASLTIPFILPPDAIYRELYFRYDVMSVLEFESGYQFLSARPTDIALALVQNSGGDRTTFPLSPNGLYGGVNQGFAMVRMPYIHPKQGSLSFTFKNLREATRHIYGWVYGTKVAS